MKHVKTERMMLGTPGTGKSATPRAARGRPCADPSCSTILSTYNNSTTCWLHSQPITRHALFTD